MYASFTLRLYVKVSEWPFNTSPAEKFHKPREWNLQKPVSDRPYLHPAPGRDLEGRFPGRTSR